MLDVVNALRLPFRVPCPHSSPRLRRHHRLDSRRCLHHSARRPRWVAYRLRRPRFRLQSVGGLGGLGSLGGPGDLVGLRLRRAALFWPASRTARN